MTGTSCFCKQIPFLTSQGCFCIKYLYQIKKISIYSMFCLVSIYKFIYHQMYVHLVWVVNAVSSWSLSEFSSTVYNDILWYIIMMLIHVLHVYTASGICFGISRSSLVISYNVGVCDGSSTFSETVTGLQSSFHVFVEEVRADLVKDCGIGAPINCDN